MQNLPAFVSVGSQEHELEKPSFEIRPLGQKGERKIEAFTRQAFAARVQGLNKLHEQAMRPDVYDFKRQFEQKNLSAHKSYGKRWHLNRNISHK
jgi:hypothetical protein